MMMKCILHTALALAALTPAAIAQTPTFNCTSPTLLGSIPDVGYINYLTIQDDFAYLSVDYSEFLIIDLSDPTAPQLLSRIEPYGDEAESITIIGDFAYLLSDDRYYIYNIEDKSDPWFVRSYRPEYLSNSGPAVHSATHIFTEDSLINITRPRAPGLDRYQLPDFFLDTPLLIRGDTLYSTNLDRFDISNPLQPVGIGLAEPGIGFDPEQMKYEPPYLIELATSTSMRYATFLPTSDVPLYEELTLQSSSYAASIRNDVLFSVGETLEVAALSPTPAPTASYSNADGFAFPENIHRYGDLFLVSDGADLEIYDIPSNPIAGARGTGEPSYIELNGDIAVLGSYSFTTEEDAVSVFDIADPANPTLLSELPFPNSTDEPSGFAFNGNQLYVAVRSGGIHQFDLSNPGNPQLVAIHETSNNGGVSRSRDIKIADGLAYVVDQRSDLTIYSIQGDGSLIPISNLSPIPGPAPQWITLLGDLAMISSSTDASLIDISNPAAPEYRTTFEYKTMDTADQMYFPSAFRDGNLLYTAENRNGYRIFDVSDASNPIELAHFFGDIDTPYGTYTTRAWRILVEDGILYLALSSGGFAIYDNSDPLNPQLLDYMLATVPQNGGNTNYRHFEKRGGLIYIASHDAGLRVLSVDGCRVNTCVADFNGDGSLNFFDVSMFLVAFNEQDPIADLQSDGSFNFFDVAAFLTSFQAGCP